MSQVTAVLFKSCSGTAYCYLTAFRDSMYFKKVDNQFRYEVPSPIDSFATQLVMEPLYLLLAVAAVVETVVRVPLMFVGLAIGTPMMLLIDGDRAPKSTLTLRVQDLLSGMSITSIFVIASCRVLFYNIYNTPIILSNLAKPVSEELLFDIVTFPGFPDA